MHLIMRRRLEAPVPDVLDPFGSHFRCRAPKKLNTKKKKTSRFICSYPTVAKRAGVKIYQPRRNYNYISRNYSDTLEGSPPSMRKAAPHTLYPHASGWDGDISNRTCHLCTQDTRESQVLGMLEWVWQHLASKQALRFGMFFLGCLGCDLSTTAVDTLTRSGRGTRPFDMPLHAATDVQLEMQFASLWQLPYDYHYAQAKRSISHATTIKVK